MNGRFQKFTEKVKEEFPIVGSVMEECGAEGSECYVKDGGKSVLIEFVHPDYGKISILAKEDEKNGVRYAAAGKGMTEEMNKEFVRFAESKWMNRYVSEFCYGSTLSELADTLFDVASFVWYGLTYYVPKRASTVMKKKSNDEKTKSYGRLLVRASLLSIPFGFSVFVPLYAFSVGICALVCGEKDVYGKGKVDRKADELLGGSSSFETKVAMIRNYFKTFGEKVF